MSFPVVHLSGPAFEQGLQHGHELRERVAHNLRVYFDRFEREVDLPRDAVLAMAREYAGAIEQQNPDYFAGMRGIAEAAGFSLDEIVALNVRYELLYYQFGQQYLTEPDGCTSFAVLPEASASGHLLLGQNWDWIPQIQGALVHTSEPDGMETLAFTEAGIWGAKIGLNSAGLGLCVNGMTTTDDDWARRSRPFHVRCYEVLRQREFESAVRVVSEEGRSCSTNFLVAQAPDQVANLEASPHRVNRLGCEGGCLVHSNHFIDPDKLGITEPPNPRRIYSRKRRARLAELIGTRRPVGIGDLQGWLQDHAEHPYGLCRHEDQSAPEEEHYITVTSVVMDLETRELWLTEGPPCGADYEHHAL